MATPDEPTGFGVLGRRLLLAFMTVAIIPLLVTNVSGYLRSRAVYSDLVAENVGKTAKLYAAQLDGFVADQRVLLRTLAAPGTDVATALTEAPHIDALVETDDGGVVISAHATGGDVPSNVIRTCATLAQSATSTVARVEGSHEQGPEILLTERVGSSIVCGRVSFALHQELLSQRAASLVGGAAYIVDGGGQVVCHGFAEHEPHAHPGEELAPDVTRRAGAHIPWFGMVPGPAGPLIAAYAPSEVLPWGVWVEVPLHSAAATLESMKHRAIGFGLLLIIGVAVAVILLARQLVTPIQRLVSATESIAAGEYGRTVPVRGSDEVASLAAAFNRMSTALRSSYDELDHRVEERTRELAEARDFSDLLLNAMEHRILVIDRDLNVIRANDAATEAYGDDVVGCGCKSIHQKMRPDESPCPASTVFETGEPLVEERTLEKGSGTEILEVVSFPVPTATGVSAVIEVARDVTEQKQLQARLAHQEKMAALGVLAAGLAHEIGNPLASLSSEVQMLDDAQTVDEVRASLPVLKDQVGRMSRLLRELVDIGRPPSDAATVFDPADLVNDVARLLRHDPRSRGIEIQVEVPDERVALCTVRDRVVQILLNLGLNALDATPAGGHIALIARQSGNNTHFEVADSGPGVPPELHSRVFEPFFTTKEAGKGTGLGLFVSQRLAAQLGGALSLVPSSEGAMFRVDLSCPCKEDS